MANALDIVFGWVPRETLSPVLQEEVNGKKRPKSRSQMAIEWMRRTGSSQRQAARRFSLTQAAISQQLKANRETCYCPECHRKMPAKRRQPKQKREDSASK